MSFYSQFKASKFLKGRYIVALLLFVAVSSVFAALADEIGEGETLPLDRYVLTAINENLSSPILDQVALVGTNAAGVPVVIGLTILGVIMLVIRKSYSKALFLGLVMAGTGAANTVLKLFFERQRPDLWQHLVNEDTFSFPSGHAMGSMAIGLTVVLLAWRTKWRIPITIGAVLYVLFIGFSRLYLGVHYPTDVLAGWLLAAGWVSTLYMVLQINKHETSSNTTASPVKKVGVGASRPN
ncbi:phosphatase PAP2 family protein [Candidatus Saccharibacteria bacterium]|nr:phosphatase PAP2 family protein [Candidatus Saccharibacteria bacterium]